MRAALLALLAACAAASAYDRAVALVERRDYAEADIVLALEAHHRDEARLWDALTWVRWGNDSIAGALSATARLDRLDPARYCWNRALLLLENADGQSDLEIRMQMRERAAAARDEVTGAHRLVLDAHFAARAGELEAAVAAADQAAAAALDPIEAYVLVRVYERAGQRDKAERLQGTIRGRSILVPIVLQRLAR